jgi:UDP-N-acetylmuramoyl-tripeptide--D-alanyl-D-alanine ligase
MSAVVTYGGARRASIAGRIGRVNEFGAPSLEVTDRRGAEPKSMTLQLRTPGRHTATNALAAAAVGLVLKVAPTKIKRTLESFEPHIYKGGYARLATMVTPTGARLLNDTYNANPDSVQVALSTLRAMKPGKGGYRMVVLGDMRELGRSSRAEHRQVGEEIAAGGGIDAAFFFGDEMRHAYTAVRKGNPAIRSFHFTDRAKLIDTVGALLSAEDIVLVKGSRGMKMEEVVVSLMTPPDEG